MIVACTGTTSESTTTSAGETATSTSGDGSGECGYLYEWLETLRFPLQADPHATYSYVVPRITNDPTVFLITGSFPYAAWTEWMVYTDKAQPFSQLHSADVEPLSGNTNPFVVGNPVLTGKREYEMLVLPEGVDQSSLPARLQSVPQSNVLASPSEGGFFILANRVYEAFPGYNPGGAGGDDSIPFPRVTAIDATTGDPADCTQLNLVPNPRSSTDMPTEKEPRTGAVSLEGGQRLSVGLDGGDNDGEGAEYAPELDPDLIEFTRPPLLPGADVSSIPPADSCAGYLGAITSNDEIGLIRIPHVAEWFDTTNLTADSVFVQEESTFISITQYGAVVGEYEPGHPNSASLANDEFLVDDTGGSTIVVWPRDLSASEQQLVFDHASDNGWALIRGGESGTVTSSNILIRMKGAAEDYQGGYAPTSEREGVPCYFDDNPDSSSWADVEGYEYVASAQNIGAGAPQGVVCEVESFLDGTCLADLQSYISRTGGSYFDES